MRVALPNTCASLHRLWAWWRGGIAPLSPLLRLRWHEVLLQDCADEAVPRRWLLSEPLSPETHPRETVRSALEALPGVGWAIAEAPCESATHEQGLGAEEAELVLERWPLGERRILGRLPLRKKDLGELPLPLSAFLLVLPWQEAPSEQPGEVVLVVRGGSRMERVVQELAFVASTEVLDGARATSGVVGPWPGAVPQPLEDMWLRLADVPLYLLERWLGYAATQPQAWRVYWQPGTQIQGTSARLWCQWGYEPALAAELDWDAAIRPLPSAGSSPVQATAAKESPATERFLFLAPQENPRTVASSAFRSLTERLVATPEAPVRTLRAAEPAAITVPVAIKPRSNEPLGRLWLLPESSLLAEPETIAGMERASRRNFTVAACTDATGEALYLVSERVQRHAPEVFEGLSRLAEPLAELKGLANVYLAASHHFVPEVGAETLHHLVYRAATAAGLAEAFAAQVGESAQQALLEQLGRESELPWAIITRESASGGFVPRTAPARSLPPPHKRDVVEAEMLAADPWGTLAEAPQAGAAPGILPAEGDGEAAVSWCVYFVSASSFMPFEKLLELLRRNEAERIRQWQRHTPIVLPPQPAD